MSELVVCLFSHDEVKDGGRVTVTEEWFKHEHKIWVDDVLVKYSTVGFVPFVLVEAEPSSTLVS